MNDELQDQRELLLLATTNYVRHEVGERIRSAREQLGMSQAKLAAILLRRQAYISELETSKTEPNATMLVLLAAALSKPVAYFFPEGYRDFSERQTETEQLTIEEREFIARLRKMRGVFDRKTGMHLLNALMDYNEKLLTAFEDDIPTQEQLDYEDWLRDQEARQAEIAPYREDSESREDTEE